MNILTELSINKAAGDDKISPMIIKRCVPELTPILSKFSLYYATRIFPEISKNARVQLIPKEGKRLCGYYRPIALVANIS